MLLSHESRMEKGNGMTFWHSNQLAFLLRKRERMGKGINKYYEMYKVYLMSLLQHSSRKYFYNRNLSDHEHILIKLLRVPQNEYLEK